MSIKTSYRRMHGQKNTHSPTLGEIFLGLNEWRVEDEVGDVHVVSKFGPGAPTSIMVKGLTRHVTHARLAYSE